MYLFFKYRQCLCSKPMDNAIMVKKSNRKNGVKEKKVKLDLFKARRGVFFAVHHFCCILQHVCTCSILLSYLNKRTNCGALA